MNANALIRRSYLVVLLAFAVALRLAITSNSYSGALTAGTCAKTCAHPLGTGLTAEYGFNVENLIGSYSPTGLTGSTTAAGIYDIKGI